MMLSPSHISTLQAKQKQPIGALILCFALWTRSSNLVRHWGHPYIVLTAPLTLGKQSRCTTHLHVMHTHRLQFLSICLRHIGQFIAPPWAKQLSYATAVVGQLIPFWITCSHTWSNVISNQLLIVNQQAILPLSHLSNGRVFSPQVSHTNFISSCA